MTDDKRFDITVPRGTIVKVEGCPVKLGEPIYIKQLTENEFSLDINKPMDYDYFEDGECWGFSEEKVDKETLDTIKEY